MTLPTSEPAGPTIVIYDAEFAVVELIRFIVEDRGCRAACVRSLAHGISACGATPCPHAFVCEHEPNSVASHLLPRLPCPPLRLVVLCAGHVPAHSADETTKYALVPKPFSCDQLMRALQLP